jgi:nicotinate (nicotinamide) nucleotide adenylyltransferase
MRGQAMALKGPLGIIGGTFDPVHFGHLATAKLAQDYFKLEKIYFVPASTPPHKSLPHARPDHRLAMLRCACKNTRGFEVWDGEIRRGGKSYTLDTLKTFKKSFPQTPLCFIIGSDNLKEIPLWHKYPELLKLATFCITHRPGHSLEVPREIKSMRFKIFPSPEWKISSTMIRDYLAKGYSCKYLLPPEVLEYINKHRLYR